MGTVHPGIPKAFVDQIRRRFRITNFVETGTFRGDSAAWAADHFQTVATIERSQELYALASQRLAPYPNVTTYLDDSRRALRDLVGQIGPTIFWLDAHWSGGTTSGVEDECPLLGELELIAPYSRLHFIVIDDARLFMMPPPRPHKAEQWPSLDQIFAAFVPHNPAMFVVEDVIALVPAWARKPVQEIISSYIAP